MAASLRKYKYSGSSSTRPSTSSALSPVSETSSSRASTSSPSKSEKMDVEDLKSQILLSLKSDILTVIKEELRSALTKELNSIKGELQTLKAEITSCVATTRAEMDQIKASVKDMEGGLSTWSDEVVSMQTTITSLQAEMTELKARYDDMEGKMRRCNIRILGVPEEPGSSSTALVSKLLTEVLQMDKDLLIDHTYRSSGPKTQGGKPRTIVAKLHYHQDCVEVLRRARSRGPLRFNVEQIAIFPDYTPSVAKARAAFTEVRENLRGQDGVRFGILYPARLRITYKGEDKMFTDPDKAMHYVKHSVITPAEARP